MICFKDKKKRQTTQWLCSCDPISTLQAGARCADPVTIRMLINMMINMMIMKKDVTGEVTGALAAV